MSRVLVTGSRGFLGRTILDELQGQNVPVRATSRSGTFDSTRDFWPADLRHSSSLSEILEDVSSVIHCAGLAHQFGSHCLRASRFFEINCEATERLARTAAAQGVKRFVFISSVAVYGRAKNRQYRNEDAPVSPLGSYANSKRQAEIRLLRVAAETGMSVFILRMGTLYGENDPGNVGRLKQAIERGRFLMIGPGENRKSLLHKHDAARACIKAALQPLNRPAGIWNVAGEPASLWEIIRDLSFALNRQPPGIVIPAPLVQGCLWPGMILGAGPIRAWAKSKYQTVQKWLAEDVYDASRFARDFQWQPSIVLKDGFHQMVTGSRDPIMETPPLRNAA